MLSKGRLRLGLGRGLARREFAAFRLSMDESRERFDEAAPMIVNALKTGFIEATANSTSSRASRSGRGRNIPSTAASTPWRPARTLPSPTSSASAGSCPTKRLPRRRPNSV
jgi:alkanesulfonate monooxygenase SsuD/methylene tetrahydromethanopterin reductase-like flavin-dependent oxidoreductase (luciferase family)